jgi:hypothetical protein
MSTTYRKEEKKKKCSGIKKKRSRFLTTDAEQKSNKHLHGIR